MAESTGNGSDTDANGWLRRGSDARRILWSMEDPLRIPRMTQGGDIINTWIPESQVG